MEICSLYETQGFLIREAAELLIENFPHYKSTIAEAILEVMKCLEDGKITLIAMEAGHVFGLAGAIPQYGVTGWELHPLVVKKSRQRQGVGTALLRALEKEVAGRGGITLYAGSDDEFGKTSLAYVDLYDHLLERVRDIKNLKGHPYEFYLKMGYQIVGVIPDANGLGKPDIWLAKRVCGRF